MEAVQQQVEKRLQQLGEQLQQKRLLANSLLIREEHLDKEKAGVASQLEQLLEQRTAIATAYMAHRDQVKELRQQVQERENQDLEAKKLLAQLQQRIAQEGSKLAALENQLRDAQLEQETSAAKTGYVSASIHSLDEEGLGLRKEIAANQEEQQQLAEESARCDQSKVQLEQELEQQLGSLQETVGGRQRYLEEKTALQQGLEQAEAAVQEGRRTATLSEGRVRSLEMDLSRQQSDYDHALEQLTTSYQLTREEAAQEELLDLDGEQLRTREQGLQQQLTALGPVNPAALEEYQAVKERSEFLNQQYQDLCQAKENLETVIGQINTGMTKKFKEAFQQINLHFASCYQKLFGGGTAVLRLANPEDI